MTRFDVSIHLTVTFSAEDNEIQKARVLERIENRIRALVFDGVTTKGISHLVAISYLESGEVTER